MPRASRAPRHVNDLAFEGMVGKGTFGTVYRARNRNTDEVLAVKEIVAGTSTRRRLEFLKEAKVLRMCNHPCLLRLVAVFVQEEELASEQEALQQKLYLVTEFCSGGALSELLMDRSVATLPWKTRIRFAHEIALGLEALHQNNLIHRDLKSDNCLLKAVPGAERDANFSHYSIVLGDFGLARWFSSKSSGRVKKMTVRGTPWTMAPELLDPKATNGYTVACDIFSLGVVLLEIACRTPAQEIPRDQALSVDMALVETMSTNSSQPRLAAPEPLPGSSPDSSDSSAVSVSVSCASESAGVQRAARGRRDSILDRCPPAYLRVVRGCVSTDPEARPAVEAIVLALAACRQV